MTNNLAWKNKTLPINTSLLVIVTNAVLSSWEELQLETKLKFFDNK